MSSEVRALLEQSEDIFGTKFGVSLGKAADNLFQKCPQFVSKIPSICSKNTLILLNRTFLYAPRG
jgi:hypothetical protein